ncbi:hypothetical protein A2U01_0058210, partial [Trifolium medium]|nr:hypothetical protein [Trifolium medium]
ANPYTNPEKNDEETDLRERSTKKKKDGDQIFSNHSSLPKDYREVVDMQSADNTRGSYCDRVLGRQHRRMAEGVEEEKEEEEMEEEGGGIKVEERSIGNYECPEFIFSKLEEKRLYRPWRRGVIVKLLGR